MSWETLLNKEKCPCGKSIVVQQVRESDWGQVEVKNTYIECDDCKKKYKIVKIYFFEPWRKGDGVNYYLVPIDLVDNAIYEHKYSLIDPYTFARNDFSKYLICSYSLSGLNNAISQLITISNCKLATGILKRIIKDRKRYLFSCKRDDLLNDLSLAISKYHEDANFELITAEKARNEEKREEFNRKIRDVGRRIF